MFNYNSAHDPGMSSVYEPMSFEDLSELYRVEMRSNALTQVRKDLFRSLADLMSRLRADYDKQMAIDPESVMCEGANQRRKKAERICKDILLIRNQKICQMAIRGAAGANNDLDYLTDEERDLYHTVMEASRRNMGEIDRLRGRKVTVDTRIDDVRPPSPPVQEKPVQEERPEPPPELFDEPIDDFMEDMFDDPADIPDPIPEEPMPEDFERMQEREETPGMPSPMTESAGTPEPEPVKEQEDKPKEPLEPIGKATDEDLEPVLVRILEDLPPFAGAVRDYELVREDLVMLPRALAEALVNSEKAVMIRPTP